MRVPAQRLSAMAHCAHIKIRHVPSIRPSTPLFFFFDDGNQPIHTFIHSYIHTFIHLSSVLHSSFPCLPPLPGPARAHAFSPPSFARHNPAKIPKSATCASRPHPRSPPLNPSRSRPLPMPMLLPVQTARHDISFIHIYLELYLSSSISFSLFLSFSLFSSTPSRISPIPISSSMPHFRSHIHVLL